MVYKIEAFLLLLSVFVHLNQLSIIAYASNASAFAYPYMVNIWYRRSGLELSTFETQRRLYYMRKALFRDIYEPQYEAVTVGPRAFFCAGTLISPKCILTAAQCRTFVNRLEFYGGSNTLGKGVSLPKGEHLFIDRYNSETGDMDMAIIRLTKPVADVNMKTIKIDYSEVKDGDTITAAGWGITDTKIAASNLREANSTVMNKEDCQIFYQGITRLTENMFCGISAQKANSCIGDAGGPIIRNGKQIGIVSFIDTEACGNVNYPVVYAKLSGARASQFLRRTIANYC